MTPAAFPWLLLLLAAVAWGAWLASRSRYDDEPVTADDLAAFARGDEARARGETVPLDDVLTRWRTTVSGKVSVPGAEREP